MAAHLLQHPYRPFAGVPARDVTPLALALVAPLPFRWFATAVVAAARHCRAAVSRLATVVAAVVAAATVVAVAAAVVLSTAAVSEVLLLSVCLSVCLSVFLSSVAVSVAGCF